MSETVNILDFEFEVDILSSTPFDPGRTSGPPEHCYPPEGGEIEWEVNPDQPIAEFIMAAVEKNSDWESSIDDQLIQAIDSREPEMPEPEPDWEY
ncbi:MAG: hypothetical protein DRI98_14510 [Bacteroidetes bacterium]|nr:MAG: hypothetical protein DRI98_14510 [Bacteroidota bacterium]